MIILDTNVLSALMRHSADKKVVEWLDEQPRRSIWMSSITILEIRYGLPILPAGKRRSALIQTFEKVLVDKIESRVARFDTVAAQQAGDLMALWHRKGRPRRSARHDDCRHRARFSRDVGIPKYSAFRRSFGSSSQPLVELN